MLDYENQPNYLQYKIDNPTERQILIGYRILLSVSTLIGDALILVGSLRYNAIKLHKIIVIFVQHMAVADIMVTIFSIIPGAVSLYANKWVFEKWTCYLIYFFNDCLAAVQCLITGAIAMSKLLIVKYPLRAMSFSTDAANIAVMCIWITGSIFPAVAIAQDLHGVYFSYVVYICDYTTDHKWSKTAHTIYVSAIGMVTLTSILGTVISSVMLLILAKRATDRRNEGLQWQGIFPILLTAAAHFLLALPLAVYYISRAFIQARVHFYRYSWWISQLGCMVNFSILSLTLPSFREFLKFKILKKLARVYKMIYSTSNEVEISVEEGERRALLSPSRI